MCYLQLSKKMNSVFSAFKVNKSDKNRSSSSLSTSKKIPNVQENSYENLRHIREIGTTNKIMSTVVNDTVDGDLLNVRSLIIIKPINEIDNFAEQPSSNSFISSNVVDCIDEKSKCISVKSAETKGINGSDLIDTDTNNVCNYNASNSCDNLNKNNYVKTPMDENKIDDFTIKDDTTTSSELSNSITTISDNQLSKLSSKLINNTTCSPIKSLNSNICNVSSSNEAIELVKSSKTTSISKNSYLSENDVVILNNDDEQLKLTVPKSVESTLPIISILSSKNACSQAAPSALATTSATATPKNSRYPKPRLSISGFNNNNSMPSVHGRQIISNIGTLKGTTVNACQPKRLSTHQRNLSLDFRSMGILLPPISQVTNTRINLTQHHRNRSLDSALQRIPEASVEVSSPNADNEKTFCTNSILGATMCSKVMLANTFTSTSTSTSTTGNNVVSDSIASKVIHTPSTTEKTTIADGSTKSSDSKKREDLTSLGSDDSGIICGSEPDQVSLNRIRQSHDSLDSAEIEPEEECIDILETISMDEDYRLLKSELCFYQTPEKDCQILKSKKKTEKSENSKNSITPSRSSTVLTSYQNKTANQLLTSLGSNQICVSINIDDAPTSNDKSLDTTPTSQEEPVCKIINTDSVVVKKPEQNQVETKSEHIKNEVLFKTLFGATKNAIFRTAQSIIDNHEKKNAAKNKVDLSDVKLPTEATKKKDFFILKSSNKKSITPSNNQENSNSGSSLITVAVISPPSSPLLSSRKTDVKPLKKSNSNTSLNKLKVPGIVKCFVTEKEQSQLSTKIEKGPSGLLRFFESPVFNIHFAIHYLFYSKEPGVLSFIGNKIFSFPDREVDLYIPQLIVMYTQMDELAEVLDPYLTIRCRKSVDFSLKCLWLLEAYNYQIDMLSSTMCTNKKIHLALMKEIFSKKERKQLKTEEVQILTPIKKTHHRSQSDAVVLLNDSRRYPSSGTLSISSKYFRLPGTPAKLCLGDLTSGRAYDNGCTCFESVRGTVNDLLGHKTVCCCGAPKNAPQKEFMKALINIGKNLTTLQTKAEKTSALRMFLNLINKNLPARVWLPLHSDIPHHIVRITEEKTAVLNSKDKTPYIIYVEVVEVCDIYSSPVILKMMPSLRHTKSEEHLESKDSSSNINKTNLKISESSSNSENNPANEFHLTEDDVWSQEDDAITAQYMNLHKISERDTLSQMSLDSCDSRDHAIPTLFNIGDVRTRHCNNLNCENTKPFGNDPEDPSAAALKEPWHEKEKLIRDSSPYGHLSNWRLLAAIVKCGDDLRQELMATQLLQMFKIIWQEECVDLWVRPYKIVCLSNDSGLIEPILNTVSLHQIKKNSNKSLREYFMDEYGQPDSEKFQLAQTNFVQSCAAYCLISYLLQVKDRHNGNILLHSDGHLIHIDFGFILSISPKNLGFEQSPFKLTPEFVDVMGGTESELWIEFNHLLLKGLMAARKHMDRIINLVEIMRSNAQLPCFKNGCSGTVQNLRKRFHMNLTEQELERKVEQLVQDSLKSLSTKLYDGYQYFTNGIL